MIANADPENDGYISFHIFRNAIAKQKQIQAMNNEDDTLDAFIALGG